MFKNIVWRATLRLLYKNMTIKCGKKILMKWQTILFIRIFSDTEEIKSIQSRGVETKNAFFEFATIIFE